MSTPRTELITRYVRADMTAHDGFKWPTSGPVSCPDWDPAPKCGNGLHGWLHGKGDAMAWDCRDGDLMLVVAVDATTIVYLDGKVKFPSGVVVYCGDAAGVSAFMAENGHHDGLIHGTSTSGNYGTSTSGVRGTSTSGDCGTSTSGALGIVVVRWYDGRASRYRLSVGYVGENGIEANTPYKCDAAGNLIEVSP